MGSLGKAGSVISVNTLIAQEIGSHGHETSWLLFSADTVTRSHKHPSVLPLSRVGTRTTLPSRMKLLVVGEHLDKLVDS